MRLKVNGGDVIEGNYLLSKGSGPNPIKWSYTSFTEIHSHQKWWMIPQKIADPPIVKRLAGQFWGMCILGNALFRECPHKPLSVKPNFN